MPRSTTCECARAGFERARADTSSSFLQYYNTPYCAARSLFDKSSGRKRATIETGADVSIGWVSWLQANVKNKAIKLYLGLPASTLAANPDHYLTPKEAEELINAFACNPTYEGMFGGVMLWEATYSEGNQINGKSYAANIRDMLDDVVCPGVSGGTNTSGILYTSTTTSYQFLGATSMSTRK